MLYSSSTNKLLTDKYNKLCNMEMTILSLLVSNTFSMMSYKNITFKLFLIEVANYQTTNLGFRWYVVLSAISCSCCR